MQNHSLFATTRVAETADLAELWQALTSGTLEIVSSWVSADECFLKVRSRLQGYEQYRIDSRERLILERILIGESQKSVSLSLGIAASTVATICGHCLETMGARRPTSRVPMLLVVAAHAAVGVRVPPALALRDGDCAGGEFVVAVERPDRNLGAYLPAAEFAVVQNLVEGQTQAEIAASRQRSPRTIANQLASTFRRLEVSSRRELLSKLVRDQALRWPALANA